MTSSQEVDNQQMSIPILKNFNKELIGFENLIFRSNGRIFLLLIPFLSAVLSFSVQQVWYENSTIVNSNFSPRLIQTLTISIFSVVIIIAYLGGFKLHQIQDNGQYGYWLALGMERKRFYIVSNLALSFYSFVSIFSSLLVLSAFSGLFISLSTILKLAILIYGTTLIITATTFLISELVNNQEFSFITSILLFSLVLFFGQDDFIPKRVVFSMNYVGNSLWIIYLGLQLLACAIILIVSYTLHEEKDIDLGG